MKVTCNLLLQKSKVLQKISSLINFEIKLYSVQVVLQCLTQTQSEIVQEDKIHSTNGVFDTKINLKLEFGKHHKWKDNTKLKSQRTRESKIIMVH